MRKALRTCSDSKLRRVVSAWRAAAPKRSMQERRSCARPRAACQSAKPTARPSANPRRAQQSAPRLRSAIMTALWAACPAAQLRRVGPAAAHWLRPSFRANAQMCKSKYLFAVSFCAVKNQGRRARPSTPTSPEWPRHCGQLVPAISPPHATCGLNCSRSDSKVLGLHCGGRSFCEVKNETPSRRRLTEHRRASVLFIGRGV